MEQLLKARHRNGHGAMGAALHDADFAAVQVCCLLLSDC